MANLNSLGFKFDVGEVAKHKLITDRYDKPETTKVVILARIAEECSGGIQLQYKCRCGLNHGVATMDVQHIYTIFEHELEKIDVPVYVSKE